MVRRNFCLRLTTASADSLRLRGLGSAAREIFGSALLQPARAVSVSLSAFFMLFFCILSLCFSWFGCQYATSASDWVKTLVSEMC